MISAKYNSPSPPPKKNKNKQTNKKQTRQNKTNKQTESKQGKKKQTNKQKQKQKTCGVLFFLNAVVIKVIGELYFGKKNLKLEEFSLQIDDEQKIGIFTLFCGRFLGRKVKRKKKEGKNSRLPIHSKAHSLDHIWGWMTLCARQVILHYLDNSFLTFV